MSQFKEGEIVWFFEKWRLDLSGVVEGRITECEYSYESPLQGHFLRERIITRDLPDNQVWMEHRYGPVPADQIFKSKEEAFEAMKKIIQQQAEDRIEAIAKLNKMEE